MLSLVTVQSVKSRLASRCNHHLLMASPLPRRIHTGIRLRHPQVISIITKNALSGDGIFPNFFFSSQRLMLNAAAPGLEAPPSISTPLPPLRFVMDGASPKKEGESSNVVSGRIRVLRQRPFAIPDKNWMSCEARLFACSN
jgi:hypothetical protein